MNSESVPDEQGGVWPPAISEPEINTEKAPISPQTRLGRISVWCSGGGVASWLLTIPLALFFLSKAPSSYLDVVYNCCYFLGLGFECAAITLGFRGRSARIAKVGLIVGAVILLLMVGLTLWDHISNGSGQWIWNESSTGEDCGCDAVP